MLSRLTTDRYTTVTAGLTDFSCLRIPAEASFLTLKTLFQAGYDRGVSVPTENLFIIQL